MRGARKLRFRERKREGARERQRERVREVRGDVSSTAKLGGRPTSNLFLFIKFPSRQRAVTDCRFRALPHESKIVQRSFFVFEDGSSGRESRILVFESKGPSVAD